MSTLVAARGGEIFGRDALAQWRLGEAVPTGKSLPIAVGSVAVESGEVL